MQIVYGLEKPPESFSKSVFLAGPTPRSPKVQSWRPQAIEMLEKKEYDGVVFVPENRPESKDAVIPDNGYPEWEHQAMNMSDLVLFWVPRDLSLIADDSNPENMVPKMPGLTTNVEYGLFAHSGKSLFGPILGDKNKYLSFVGNKFHIPQFYTLEEMLNEAVLKILQEGALRQGGEREIPLFIWRHRAFQNWYKNLKSAGNRLDGASVEWISRVRSKPEAVFAFVIRPNIFIASENRNKINDPVVFRLDISSVVLYKKKADALESEIILVKEFRSASSTRDGFIWELPGGSSPHITNPLQVAIEELKEEVGLNIPINRFNRISSRQMAGTLSVHRSHTYSVKLTDQELAWLKSQKNIPHGSDYPDNPTGERAYTEIVTLKEILAKNLVDWANLGMILSVVR